MLASRATVGLLGLAVLAGCFTSGVQAYENPPFFLQIDIDCYSSNVTKGNGCGGSLEGGPTSQCTNMGASYTLLSCCPTMVGQGFNSEDQLACQTFLPPYDPQFSEFHACSGTLPYTSCCCVFDLDGITATGAATQG